MIRRLFIAVLCLVAPAAQAQSAPTDSLRIVFFDVGQGDASLILAPDGKRVLIDAGPGGSQIVEKLTALETKTLDLVITTHNHADHLGGMADVFAAFRVREYIDNGIPALTQAYRRTVDAVDIAARQGLVIRAATTRDFRLGKVTLGLLAPPHKDDTQNDNSIGMVVQFGTFAAVLTGDAEKDELGEWFDRYEFPRVSVLKASHHGSSNGVSDEWMDNMRPKVVVISVGANNQYGHPAREVLLGWSSRGARVYRTDAVGTIVITAAADGGFTVRTTSGEMPWVSK